MSLSKLLICLVICLLETENRFVVSNTLIQIHDRGTQSINNQFQLITVDIKNCSTNSEVVCDYNTSDNSSTFTANPGYLINKVTKRDTVLWDAKDYNNVYSNRVFVGFNESLEPIFRVYFPGEPPKLSVPVPPKPLKPDLTKPTLITLDVKIKEPTNEILYEYDKRNQTHTFTPLPGFAIDRVVKGRNQMWKCEDGVYPEKVLIILDQGGDQVLRFQFPEPEHHTKGVEIITEGSKKPNDGSKIELIRVCRGRFHFIPKPGSKCIMVKCDGQVVDSYIMKNVEKDGMDFHMILKLHKIIDAHNQYCSDVIWKTGQPEQNDLEYLLLELDIKVKHTDQYVTYKKNPRTEREKFTCKPGYLVSKVVKSGDVITEVENEQYYDRVILYKDQAGNRSLRCLFPGQIDVDDPDEPLPNLESDAIDHKLAVVDIGDKYTTDEIQYERSPSNNYYTLTAKEGYLISKVTKRDQVLWDSKDYGNECGNRVYVGFNELGEKVFRVYFPKQAPILHSKLPELKLKPNEIVLDVLEFVKKRFDPKKSPERTIYNVIRVFNDLDYRFNPKIRCVRVTCGNVRVWDKGERRITCPTSVSYITDLDQVVVRDNKRGVTYQRAKGTMYYISTSHYADFYKPEYHPDYYPHEPDGLEKFSLIDPGESSQPPDL
ncbi:hypothetical protein MACJ_001587 [Theileria orientalis]|uniref:6-Cys domain-containing protein n=1 Tax=Theileria orientalis TaxID=68886 RepID=A0A976MAF6_THEOR|nr:hypothetical protein MACJ_001587 [Theileria orientalis]